MLNYKKQKEVINRFLHLAHKFNYHVQKAMEIKLTLQNKAIPFLKENHLLDDERIIDGIYKMKKHVETLNEIANNPIVNELLKDKNLKLEKINVYRGK